MNTLILRTLVLLFLTTTALHAQAPLQIKYNGRVTVGGVDFNGAGLFKFALINDAGTMTFWSNDGTSSAGSEPATGVPLPVTWGLYSVVLGDTSLPNMMALPPDDYEGVLVRVWFNDGTHGSQLIQPDQRIRIDCATGVADTWHERERATGMLAGRSYHTALWTGSEMIVWGGDHWDGNSTEYFNDGARYDPATNRWTALNATGAPAARSKHTAVWTGSEMIVWGGHYHDGSSHYLNDGARYNPANDTWTPMTTVGAPAGREVHAAVWTGSEMIVWGGQIPFNPNASQTGGRYNPVDNSWKAVSTTDAPVERFSHTAVWTGSEMIVWGGTSDYIHGLGTGGRYSPAADHWSPVSTTGAPAARAYHTAVWAGSAMIVWGGFDDWTDVDDTFAYTPECEPFRITNATISNGNLVLSFPTVTGIPIHALALRHAHRRHLEEFRPPRPVRHRDHAHLHRPHRRRPKRLLPNPRRPLKYP